MKVTVPVDFCPSRRAGEASTGSRRSLLQPRQQPRRHREADERRRDLIDDDERRRVVGAHERAGMHEQRAGPSARPAP